MSSVLRNSLAVSGGEREEGILSPTVLLCGIGMGARVNGQSIKLTVLLPPINLYSHVL